MPVAVNCCVVFSDKEGLFGVTEMDTRAAGPTLKVSCPVTDPKVAEIVVAP